MLTSSEIGKIKAHTIKHFISLRARVEKYKYIIESLKQNRNTFRENIYRMSFSKPDMDLLTGLEKLTDSYRHLDVEREILLREIDNIAAIVSGNIALVLDECLNDYEGPDRIWCKLQIGKIADLRTTESYEGFEAMSFPTATAILAPYLFKTMASSNPARFAGIRNAIRDLMDY